MKKRDQVSTVKASLSPHRLRESGTAPDYRFSLANERTFLAWLRTSLALMAGGVAIAQFLPPLRVAGLREGIAATLLLMGAACAVRAVLHWAACEKAMRHGQDLPLSRFPTALAALVAFGAVGLLVAVFTGVFAP